MDALTPASEPLDGALPSSPTTGVPITPSVLRAGLDGLDTCQPLRLSRSRPLYELAEEILSHCRSLGIPVDKDPRAKRQNTRGFRFEGYRATLAPISRCEFELLFHHDAEILHTAPRELWDVVKGTGEAIRAHLAPEEERPYCVVGLTPHVDLGGVTFRADDAALFPRPGGGKVGTWVRIETARQGLCTGFDFRPWWGRVYLKTEQMRTAPTARYIKDFWGGFDGPGWRIEPVLRRKHLRRAGTCDPNILLGRALDRLRMRAPLAPGRVTRRDRRPEHPIWTLARTAHIVPPWSAPPALPMKRPASEAARLAAAEGSALSVVARLLDVGRVPLEGLSLADLAEVPGRFLRKMFDRDPERGLAVIRRARERRRLSGSADSAAAPGTTTPRADHRGA